MQFLLQRYCDWVLKREGHFFLYAVLREASYPDDDLVHLPIGKVQPMQMRHDVLKNLFAQHPDCINTHDPQGLATWATNEILSNQYIYSTCLYYTVLLITTVVNMKCAYTIGLPS